MQLKGTIAFKDQFFLNFFSLLCQTRYYYVNHSIQEHVFQNVETQFFFTKIYSKIEFFHCQSVNSQLQQVTANDPQSVFFTAEHPDSWISIT